MKIILPPHKLISVEVTEITDDVIKEICQMRKLLEINEFDNGRTGIAIAHCQVSSIPLRLFVAVKGIIDHDVIVNPKILEKSGKYTARELCLSFPFRPEVKVKRYEKIKVEYQDIDLNRHVRELDGVAAQIFQHEIQHFNGKSIYDQS